VCSRSVPGRLRAATSEQAPGFQRGESGATGSIRFAAKVAHVCPSVCLLQLDPRSPAPEGNL
jgi:hypothetical protein